MTLAEYLSTASPDNETSLSDVLAHTVTQPVFITSNTMTVYVVQAGLYDVFTDTANDETSPVRGICLALMDRLRGQSEFNLSASLPLGQANLQMLEALRLGLPQHAEKIAALRDKLVSVSGQSVQPFASATLHDVLIARDACARKAVSVSQGFAVINTSADCLTHNPRLFALNPRTGLWQRINSFYNVSTAGAYEAQIPREWLGAQLAVDDAYGVM